MENPIAQERNLSQLSEPMEDGKEPKAEESSAKTPIKQLRELVEIQGRDGNWNFDSYMCGMFNGMELALSIMEGREPNYRTLKPIPAEPACAGLTVCADMGHQILPHFGSASL